MSTTNIPPIFIQHAADILAETTKGLSGGNIIKATVAYALEYRRTLPYFTYPFGANNKRTVLYENLMAFAPSEQYRIIKELCDHPSFTGPSPERRDLKLKLVSEYSYLDESDAPSNVNADLIDQTRHWLADFPESLTLFDQALLKYKHGAFQRNLLDDMRLSLEKLLHAICSNSKSLENQIADLGKFVKAKGGSAEFRNMLVKLIDYYAHYNNTYIKHDDAVIEEEVEFVIEITASFMKQLVRLTT